ncbi:MAG: hypothetical protein HYS13_15730 [Planctomycetia bacterium]|nr:hypothetical protein [Planctomycetia bacterium]
MKTLALNLAAAAVWSCLAVSAAAAERWEPLVGKLPEPTNAVAVIDVQALLESPRAKKEGWREMQETGYLAGAVAMPPSVQVAIIGAHLQVEDPGNAETVSLALFKPGTKISLERLVSRENGQLDQVADRTIALTPRGGYVTEVSPGVFASQWPPDRQCLARWLREWQEDGGGRLSPYLLEALYRTDSSQIIVAFDMEDLFGREAVELWLKHSPVLKGNSAAADNLDGLIAGMRGIRLSAQVGERTQAEVRADFRTPVGVPAATLRGVFAEWLEQAGAQIDEFRKADVRVDGRSVFLTTELSDDSLRRLLTLVQAPVAGAEPSTAPPETRAMAGASQSYFRAVRQLIDDLTRMNKRAKDYEKTALWHETYARKIEQLSINNVDPELIDYAGHVSSHLRALAASLRGVPLELKTLEGQKRVRFYPIPWYTVRYGAWGVVPYTMRRVDNLDEIRAKQAAAIAAGAADREKIWREIADLTQEIRQTMAQKYKLDFEIGR